LCAPNSGLGFGFVEFAEGRDHARSDTATVVIEAFVFAFKERDGVTSALQQKSLCEA
jgi:hypothetical protein